MTSDEVRQLLETSQGALPLSRLLVGQWEAPTDSLRDLSSNDWLAKPGVFPSGLVKRVAAAWATPLDQITCAQVRVLVTQQFGLEWLARPVALFVRQFPRVATDLYPGDLTVNALIASPKLLQFAPVEAQDMLRGDFGWIEEEIAAEGDSTGLLRKALDALAGARRIASMT